MLFLIYTFISELNALFGDGELARILFTWRSTELKQTRRQRIRTLTKLSRLADAYTTDELADPATAAHTQMIGLIRSLGNTGTSRSLPAPVEQRHRKGSASNPNDSEWNATDPSGSFHHAARQPRMIDIAMNYIGFRCVVRDQAGFTAAP